MTDDEALLSEDFPLFPHDDTLRQIHRFDVDDAAVLLAALDAKRPLLLRGEPGVGKTQFAMAAAVALGRAYVSHAVDALTEPRDLRWWEDAVERLAQAQVSGLTQPGQTPEDMMKKVERKNFIRPGPLWWAFSWSTALEKVGAVPPQPDEERCKPEKGVVVLIDEIDKADPSVPNGLLEALGSRSFTPPTEDAQPLTPNIWPIVIVTSNDERRLPDAFLRRCVVYDMEVPAASKLVPWLVARGRLHFQEAEFPGATDAVLKIVAEQVQRDREKLEGRKPLPGQAEYLDLLRALFARGEQTEQAIKARLDRIGRYFLRKHGNQKDPPLGET